MKNSSLIFVACAYRSSLLCIRSSSGQESRNANGCEATPTLQRRKYVIWFLNFLTKNTQQCHTYILFLKSGARFFINKISYARGPVFWSELWWKHGSPYYFNAQLQLFKGKNTWLDFRIFSWKIPRKVAYRFYFLNPVLGF